MSILLAIFLGIIQGITEFLPVSSSGHLSIIQKLFNSSLSPEQHLLFDAILHLGTLAAIFLVYRKDLKKMAKGGVRLLQGNMDFSIFGDPLIPPTRQLLCLVVASLPLLVLLLLNKYLLPLFSMTGFIGFAMIGNGFLLFACDKLIRSGQKKAHNLRVTDALWIGLAQLCAVIPGLSSLAATLTVGLSRECSPGYAMRFSLLLAIPAIVGSFLVSLGRCFSAGMDWSCLPACLVGLVFAALTGFAAIHLLRLLMRRGRFGALSTYCWAVGSITLILSIIL